jgi:hypothetical protein
MSRRGFIIGLVGICCLSGALIFCLGDGFVIGTRENQDDGALEVAIWSSQTSVEQTFIASMDNLARIDFRLDSYSPLDSPYIECRLFEIDTEEIPADLGYEEIVQNSTEVRFQRISGWLLSGHMFNSMSFTPIPDSKEKRYLFSLRFPEIKKGGSSIVLASPVDRYLYYGNIFVNGERKKGDLAFRALYTQPRLQLIRQMCRKLALQKPGIFALPGTYYGIAGAYCVLLLCLLYWVCKKPFRPE